SDKWLLVIDNLDDITLIKDYLPSTNALGHTVITSRNKYSDRIPARGLEILPMESEECIEFLIDQTIVDDILMPRIHSLAPVIVEELGYLPLAIEQAAAYIRMSQNIDEFLLVFHNQRRDFLEWSPQTNSSYYPYTIAT